MTDELSQNDARSSAFSWRRLLGSVVTPHMLPPTSLRGLVLLCFVFPATPSAQAPRTVPIAESGCSTCRATLESVGVLTIPEIHPGFIRGTRLVLLPSGRIAAGPLAEPGKFAVFSADLRFERLVGRVGDGPGEFRVISSMHATGGDTIWVACCGGSRISAFLSSGRFIRTYALGSQAQNFLFFDDGRFVANAEVSSSSRVGHPLHFFRNGRIGQSVGAAPGPFVPATRRTMSRAMTGYPGRDSLFLTLPPNRYDIEVWSKTGRLVETWTRRPSWFSGWTTGVSAPPWIERPQTSLAAIWWFDRNTVATMAVLPDASWKPMNFEPTMSAFLPSLSATEQLVDRYLDFIDVSARRSVASVQIPANVAGVLGRNLLYEKEEDEDGQFALRIWRVAIKR